METKENRASILQMARGAIQERVDYEISKIVENILDYNTEPCLERKLTLTIKRVVPYDDLYALSRENAARTAH